LLNDQWVIEEIREEINIPGLNENRNTTYQNLWSNTKASLRGKFTAMSDILKRTERSQINDQILYLKLLEKQESKTQNKQKERNNKNKD
jgi:hypothetical protein